MVRLLAIDKSWNEARFVTPSRLKEEYLESVWVKAKTKDFCSEGKAEPSSEEKAEPSSEEKAEPSSEEKSCDF